MTPEERQRLAAEHVLGLLDAEDSFEAERLLRTDSAFAAVVAEWRTRFSELDETAEPSALPAGLWERIEGGIVAGTSPTQTPVAQGSRSAGLRGVWNSLGFWRGAGMAGALAALLLAIGLATVLRQQARTPVLVAILVTGENQPAAVVNAFADGRTELVPLKAITVPADRALQVWTLWDRARGPVSVGLLDRARSTTLGLEGLPLQPDQLFEITLEPATGSPTGRPTGPILMKGNAARAL